MMTGSTGLERIAQDGRKQQGSVVAKFIETNMEAEAQLKSQPW